jgi:hypothetical protein
MKQLSVKQCPCCFYELKIMEHAGYYDLVPFTPVLGARK